MDSNQKYPIDTIMRLAGVHGVWMIDPDWGISQLNYYSTLFKSFDTKADMIAFLKEVKKESQAITLVDIKSSDVMQVEGVGRVGEMAIGRSIANIRLSGPMFLEDDLCHYGMNTFAQTLRSLDSINQIKGVVISVNSGGGESLAGQKVYSAVKEFSKPIVAHVEMAGSAAYFSILAADRIIGEGPLSTAGSIGVLASMDKKFVKFVSENYEDIYSDLSPGKNKWWRDYMDGDTTQIRKEINAAAQQFHNLVLNHRPLGYGKKETLEGGMFLGVDAKKRGLLDSIGTFKDAVNQLKKIIN